MKYFRHLVSALLMAFVCFTVQAQQNHFIYLQTENKQPFYVKMGKTIYNSTVSGYLIIPRLKEGNYDFYVGFVNAAAGEQKFTSTVSRQDIGYILKQFGEKGWGLFNLQTLQVTMTGMNDTVRDIPQNASVKTDDFSQMLSTVVNDPAIKYEQAEPSKQKKTTPDTVVDKVAGSTEGSKTKIDSDFKQTGNVAYRLESKPDAIPNEKPKEHSIVKTTQQLGKEGLNMVYVESDQAGNRDTISVLIPMVEDVDIDTSKTDPLIFPNHPLKAKIESLKADSAQQSVEGLAIKTTETVDNVSVPKTNSKTEVPDHSSKENAIEDKREDKDKKFLNTETASNDSLKEDIVPVSEKANKSAVTGLIVSSNITCTGYGNESDFLKLRKKMAAADAEDDMINIAKKAFKSKCYSTDQIRNLGVLFLNDAGRYNFFDAAYPHVYDTNNFILLESQLTDEYYKNRFKAMLRH